MYYFQTCDACFKSFEPLLQKVMEKFNDAVTTFEPNCDRNTSESQSIVQNGKPHTVDNSYILTCSFHNFKTVFFSVDGSKSKKTVSLLILIL